MKVAKYKVYKCIEDETIIMSIDELPAFEIREKNKYVGRKAKAETIRRLTGKILPGKWSTKQVNDYVGRLYKTNDWRKYREVLEEVANERIKLEAHYELLYQLEIYFKVNINIKPDDKNLMKMAAAIVGERPLDDFQEISKYIAEVKKSSI